MSVLVTGCAGFIGSNVSRLLLEEGHKVFGVDNLNDAYSVRLKNWRLNKLKQLNGFTFNQLDISDQNAISPIFSNQLTNGDKLSVVFNLGAMAGVRASVDNPSIYYDSNVTGTLNLLELCREFDTRKFVLSSTSSVYGDQTKVPFKESYNTDRPLSPYAASKKAAEALLYSYHHIHGIDTAVLRYFTVYGPAGRPDMSIFRFIKGIAEEETITVFGDGSQSRDFTYVGDIARGTILASQLSGHTTINLGNDTPVVLTEVIKIIEKHLNKKAKIKYEDIHSADVKQTWANIDIAKSKLNWTPSIDIEEGVRNTVNWYQENRDWAKYLT